MTISETYKRRRIVLEKDEEDDQEYEGEEKKDDCVCGEGPTRKQQPQQHVVTNDDDTKGRIFTVTAPLGVTKLGLHVLKYGIVHKVNSTSVFKNEIQEFDQLIEVNSSIKLTDKSSDEIATIISSLCRQGTSDNVGQQKEPPQPVTFTVLRKPTIQRVFGRRSSHNDEDPLPTDQQHPAPLLSPPSYIEIAHSNSTGESTGKTAGEDTCKTKGTRGTDQTKRITNKSKSGRNHANQEKESQLMRTRRQRPKATRMTMAGTMEFVEPPPPSPLEDNDDDDNLTAIEIAEDGTVVLMVGDLHFDDEDGDDNNDDNGEEDEIDIEKQSVIGEGVFRGSNHNNGRRKRKDKSRYSEVFRWCRNDKTSNAKPKDGRRRPRQQCICVVSNRGLCFATIGLVFVVIAAIVLFFVFGVINSNN